MPELPVFDYIVVGAGTAGCVLAARLSEDDRIRVLLLEAGSADRTRAMTVPSAWPENLGTAADWAQVTTAQADAGPIAYPRGRALGGGSAINAMGHVRAHPAVYDGWAENGGPGWGHDGLRPYFRRSERADGRDPALRGTDGPVPVGPATTGRHPVAQAFAAGLAATGWPPADDLSGATPEGVAWVDLAIAGGQRVSSADAYLRPVLDRPNLTVRTGCLVTGLDVRDGRCAGVSYVAGGVRDRAGAGAEVVLAAGAIGSPQLLLRSGIGPAGALRACGLDVVADVAGVGQNLQDHPVAMVTYAAAEPLPASRYNHGEVYAAVRTELADGYPDLHLFPILLPLAAAGFDPPGAGCNLVAAVVAPSSRGSVRLASPAPDAAPLIDPGFLTHPRDLDRLEAGLRMIRAAAATPGFAAAKLREQWPGPGATGREALRGYIRRAVGSYWHPAGTCRMGTGADAVVDPELKVRGVDGLRVADAAIMPTITNAHPNATVLAIAERAAALILGERLVSEGFSLA
ncbi:MAG TPA: GMC family oxidoreductase N-terminal domain-containing protein [Streptosporangiaceae bacterium]